MNYRRLVLVLALGAMCVAGSEKNEDGVKMTPAAQEAIDKTAAIIETVVPIVSPYADIVPYGKAILIALAGAAVTYLKVRPYIVALPEIVGKVQKVKKMLDRDGPGVAADFVRGTFADNTPITKKVVAKIKKTL